MKILADMHLSPITVHFLQTLGHNAIRVNEILPSNSSDTAIPVHHATNLFLPYIEII